MITELDKIAKRIAGRESACDAISLAKEGKTSDQQFMIGVAKYCREFADTVLGPIETQVKVMTDEEAQAYEKSLMQFGRYATHKIKDVPIDYLCWIADSNLKLQSYLRSLIGEKRKDLEA